MDREITGKTHLRGRGRAYLGLGIAGIALFWMAKKAGWVGVGSSGIFWPLLALGLGLAMIAGAKVHTRRRTDRNAVG